MTHPDVVDVSGVVGEQQGGRVAAQLGPAVLTPHPAPDGAAELLGDDAGDVSVELSVMFDELAQLAEALSVLGDVTPRSRDAIASVGERCSVPLVVGALARCGVAAREVDARGLMITDDRFGRAEPLADVLATRCNERVTPLAKSGTVPVLGGYIGATRGGVTTTLGRGGSDYSAALIGAEPDTKSRTCRHVSRVKRGSCSSRA